MCLFKRHAILTGWLCMVASVFLFCVSLWLFPIYLCLYVAAITMSVVAMRQKHVLAGVVLLVFLLTVPTALWCFVTIYRVVDATDHGIGFLQKHIGAITEEGQRHRQAQRAEREARGGLLARIKPGFGAWTVTFADENGEHGETIGETGGFERYDGQQIVFVLPYPGEQSHVEFTLNGDGKGEWHDEPWYNTKGWFELVARTADLATTRRIDFRWNDDKHEGQPPKRGSFIRK